MSKSVYLSPSTQEGNIGAAGYGTEEKRMNQVCDVTQKILEAHGLKTYRNKPEMTLKQLVADSNSKNPDIHLAIHSNAGGSSNAGRARGAEIYCYRFGGEGEKLARAIYNRLSPITPSSDRGVKESHSHFGLGKPLYETAYTSAPAALVEIAFHDNADDSKWIMANISVIGTTLARGVLDYFGIGYIEEKPQEPKPEVKGINVGTIVEIRQEALRYYPEGAKIPDWVKSDYLHKVTQTLSNGKPVIKNGKQCVLLGIKIRKTDKKELTGINTWVALDNLAEMTDLPSGQVFKTHTVLKGDTLWDISKKYLGSGFRYPEIMSLNKLQNTLLGAGQNLKLPKK